MLRRLSIVVLLVAGVTLMVLAGTHNLRHRQRVIEQSEAASMPANSSSSSDTGDQPFTKAMLGKAAPGFTLVDVEGNKVSLDEYKGHAVVLNFWATYCPPCKLEMPWFQALQNKYKDQGLVILGLDEDDGMPLNQVAAAARQMGVTYPILIPDDSVSRNYQLSDYIPETFYIDKSGKIVDETIGAHSKDELEADIQKAIAGGA